MTTFAERLKLLMYEKDLNRSQVARRLGVAVSTVHRWFTDDNQPNFETTLKLAEIFGVSDRWLRGLSDERYGEGSFKPVAPPEPEVEEDTKKEDEVDEELVRLIRGLSPQQIQRVRDFLAGLRG